MTSTEPNPQQPFKNIAVIGAGTMGSGIAAQIANAGGRVLLLDLAAGPNEDMPPAQGAIERLGRSDPPQLMHKRLAEQITPGTLDEDFDKLAECDWIIEAVVERLDIKKALYKRLDATIQADCVVTSNTSTIPIRLLVEDMPQSFRKRFAITHYFNPVRYMRLLELVRGEETDADVIDRLADFNDMVLGKGVVRCADTPGFLGNRVGVFALQAGMDEAMRCKLDIEQADAIMGRPMGIPKTGVFALYDLIGVDLMVDVVASLRSILPKGDAFHKVAGVSDMITRMIETGYTGNKGRGGFYVTDKDGAKMARPLGGKGRELPALRPARTELPDAAIRAAAAEASRREPLAEITKGDDACAMFARRCLARVLAYAASLVPDITSSPQDIDDAMKLGFNWQRGPFEMIDALGRKKVRELVKEAGLDVPPVLDADAPFYRVSGGALEVRHADGAFAPVDLAPGVMRFHMMRRTMKPIQTNNAASLFAIDDDLRLVEFHSKANALTADSMRIVAAAAKNHGRGIVIHNDAQHFSAGVDLNAFRKFIEAGDWKGIDDFLSDFQKAVRALRYTPVPVVGAPSGLAVGGGYEVLAHCDKLVAHTNSIFGLVESAVGVVPGGGGVMDTYIRWQEKLGNWEDAAWKAWMNLGYGATGSSPELSAGLQHFLMDRDEQVMNRDRLLPRAIEAVKSMQDGYTPPKPPDIRLADQAVSERMIELLDKGVADGQFMPHDKTVAMEMAGIMLRRDDEPEKVDEMELYARERRAFITLSKTPQTLERITTMLDEGAPVRN